MGPNLQPFSNFGLAVARSIRNQSSFLPAYPPPTPGRIWWWFLKHLEASGLLLLVHKRVPGRVVRLPGEVEYTRSRFVRTGANTPFHQLPTWTGSCLQGGPTLVCASSHLFPAAKAYQQEEDRLGKLCGRWVGA